MKPIFIILLSICLFSCNQGNNKKQKETPTSEQKQTIQNETHVPSENFEEINTAQLSSKGVNQFFKDMLVKEAEKQIKDCDNEGKYAIEFIDLNEDDIEEAFIFYWGNRCSCGSGGCSVDLFALKDDSLSLISRFIRARVPFYVDISESDKFKNIILKRSGGGIHEPEIHVFKYKNGTYHKDSTLSNNKNIALRLREGKEIIVLFEETYKTIYGKTKKQTLVTIENFEEIDIAELNIKLSQKTETLSPEDIMKVYYPLEVSGEGNEEITISERILNKGIVEVQLIHDNLLDDSVKGEKYIMELKKQDDKWGVVSLKKNWKCWDKRGHTDWGIESCK